MRDSTNLGGSSTPAVSDHQGKSTRGRALLILGRTDEARVTLGEADQFWRKFDPDNPWAAEASWWFAQSLIATGESERGQEILKQTRPRLLASWMPSHRALVAAAETQSQGN
jgi:hypothetical protein